MDAAPDTDPIFAGGGEMGRIMAAHDWSATGVGPPATWPVSLRSVVRILLTSRFSMWMGWGPELTFFYNDAYQRDTLRTKHPWALGRPTREVWSEIWHDVGPRVATVMETGEATWDEALLLVLERSGYPEETYHTFSYSPLDDEDGQVAGLFCVVAEVTDPVLSERRLRLLGELGDISAATAPTVEDASAAAMSVLGRGWADVPFSAVYLLDDDERGGRRCATQGPVAGLPDVLRPDDPLWATVRFAEPGGTGVGASQVGGKVAIPLATGGGQAAVLVVGTNPLRALDADYRRFLDLLARQIGTALGDAQAYQVQRQRADSLAELDRAKTEFFAGVSHELRTPLTLITGPVEDALADLDAPLPPTQRTRIELVLRNSGRLRRLVDTILEFSRLEGGGAVPDRIAVDLAALTRGLAESFAPAVTRAGLGFAVTCPTLPCAVSVDVDMWEKVVLNLLSNAVKYTHDGKVTVELASGPDGGVELRVRDTGIGIAAAEQPLLFQRFHRVQGASGRSHEGSGIGLALVSELAALHGGTVSVHSAPGAGSLFTVHLPPAAVAAPTAVAERPHVSSAVALYREEALAWSSPDPPAPTRPDPGAVAGATVLVAEDNPDLRRFLAGLLEPSYTVLLAADGATALRRTRTERPDLVLTDAMMPGLDGFELLRSLRAHPATATIPVIMLSARAGEEAAIEGLSAGADDYLVKPFSSADLLARVRSNLALARVRGDEAARRTALINAMQDGLFVMTPDGTVVETNAAFHTIFGYGPDGLPFAPPHPWWPDAAAEPEAAEHMRRAMEDIRAGAKGPFVLSNVHGDGHRIWVEAVVDSVLDQHGEPVVSVGTVRDVTSRQRIAERDRLLADTGRLLAQPGTLLQRLDDLVRAAAPVLGGLAAVLLTRPNGTLQAAAAASPLDPARAVALLARPPVEVADALRERMSAGSGFLTDDPGLVAQESGSLVVVPLMIAGRQLGSLLCATTDRRRPLDDTDLATAEELGRRVALMIETHRLSTRERQLHGLTAALAAAGGVDAAARVLVAGVLDVTGAVTVGALIVRPGRAPEPVFERGEEDTLVERFGHARLGELAPVLESVRTGAPVWLADGRAYAALPLPVGDRVVGALSVGFGTPRAFDDDERAFLQTLATEAGLAFERAALADTRRELAETLQHSLLPPALPDHDRLTLAARYLPAASGSRTGGDWYDVLTLDEDRVAIVVGDVVGQGPAAAAVMGQLRSALSAYLLLSGSPTEALTWADRYSHRVPGARASTAICVVLDTRTGGLRWARAGHPPPLVVRGGRPDATPRARYLDDATGTVFGVTGAPPFTEGRAALEPGDTLVLYTDGLVERRDEVLDDGLDRLAAAASGPAQPVHRFVPAVLLAALDGAGPADDVALIVARLRPAPLAGAHPAVPATLAALRREVQDWARAAALAEELTEDLQLVLGEAVANSVEHAYAGRAPGEVRVRVNQDQNGDVRIEVSDDGAWLPPGDPGYRGRGLLVIRSLGHDLVLDHDPAGTRLGVTLRADGRDEAGLPVTGRTASGSRVIGGGATGDGATGGGATVRRAADGTLHLAGNLDLGSVPTVRAVVLDAARNGPVVLDLREVALLASAGLGLLVEAAAAGPVRLRVVPDGPVARVLALTGVDRMIQMEWHEPV